MDGGRLLFIGYFLVSLLIGWAGSYQLLGSFVNWLFCLKIKATKLGSKWIIWYEGWLVLCRVITCSLVR